MRHAFVFGISIAILVAPSSGLAQQAEKQQFRLPQEETSLPDVTVFDENGNKFSTRELRGHYTVLVFGCLT